MIGSEELELKTELLGNSTRKALYFNLEGSESLEFPQIDTKCPL